MVKFTNMKSMMSKKINILTVILFLIVLFCILSISSVDNLLHSVLGRALLILIVLFSGNCNIFLGVFVVVGIILAYQSSENSYYLEGFDNSMLHMSTGVSSAVNAETSKQSTKPVIKEDFDMVGLESNIKKGNQSKSIPTTSTKSNADV